MRIAPALLAILCSACANHRYFAPRENGNGTGPGGHPAALYALGAAPVVGEVRVWSPGTRFVDGSEAVELLVGFELENTGAQPIAIDTASLRCDDLAIDGRKLTGLVPARCDGPAAAGPGTSARLDVAFLVPDCRHPRDVDGFTLRFRVLANDEPLLVQATPFGPWVRNNRSRDDWWWGYGYHRHTYWGPGIGLGFGWYQDPWCW